MFLGLLDPDPLVRGTDPDPDPSLIFAVDPLTKTGYLPSTVSLERRR
jgi:hypothetical protein